MASARTGSVSRSLSKEYDFLTQVEEAGAAECIGCDKAYVLIERGDCLRGFIQWVILIGTSAALISSVGFSGIVFAMLPLWAGAILATIGTLLCGGMKPTFKWIVFWVSILFLGEMLYFRGFAVSCRRKWKLQLATKKELHEVRTITPGDIAEEEDSAVHGALFDCVTDVETWRDWEAGRKEYCCKEHGFACEERRLHGHQEFTLVTNMATWKNVSDLEIAAYCDANLNPNFGKEIPTLGRCAGVADALMPLCSFFVERPCEPWTCMYTAQRAGGVYRYMLSVVGSIMATSFFVLNPCRSRCLSQLLGLGSFPRWLQWYWILFLPNLIIEVSTFVKGVNYRSQFLGFWIVTGALLRDAYFTVSLIGILGGGVLLVLNRRKIKNLLGLEDTSLLRINELFGMGFSSGTEQFQICVWMVLSKQPDGHPSSPAASRDSRDSDATFFSRFLTSSGNPSKSKLLPNQQECYNSYVRLGYGENEPQQSRVVSGAKMTPDTKIMFKQSFQFNMLTDLAEVPLYITVREQEVLGSKELGRVVLDPQMMKHKVREAEDIENNYPGAGESLATRQLTEMLKSQPNREEMFDKLGFEIVPLSQGGAIVLAFAKL